MDVVRYSVDDRLRMGVASTFLAERVQEGDPARVYVQKAHAFGLPKDPATPIIMVGPGTGIAPFRAFLQDRLVTRAQGPAWLFFGHQREATDFFYRDEIEEFLAKGALTRLSTAWSRDGAGKVYVQDRMRETRGGTLALARGRRAHLPSAAMRAAWPRTSRRAFAETSPSTARARRRQRRSASRRTAARPGATRRTLLMNALSPVPERPPSRTTCPYCGVGCGVIATPDGMGGAAIEGDPEHPANFGRLCSKGSALGETLGLGHQAAASDAARRRWHDAAREHGTRRSTASPKGFARTIARARPRQRRASTSPASS